jgi:acetate CoA/acetoacetate CoA-transferase beta subunit
MNEMDPQELIARRVAQEIRPGTLVNLGIGLPTQVARYLPPGTDVYLQAENGIVGLGVRPPEGMEDPDLTDAGGGFVTAIPGAARVDSALSFGLIRGGHLDMTVLGGLQVDELGRLANWMVPGSSRRAWAERWTSSPARAAWSWRCSTPPRARRRSCGASSCR